MQGSTATGLPPLLLLLPLATAAHRNSSFIVFGHLTTKCLKWEIKNKLKCDEKESFEGNEDEKKKERKQLCAKLKELEKEKN